MSEQVCANPDCDEGRDINDVMGKACPTCKGTGVTGKAEAVAPEPTCRCGHKLADHSDSAYSGNLCTFYQCDCRGYTEAAPPPEVGSTGEREGAGEPHNRWKCADIGCAVCACGLSADEHPNGMSDLCGPPASESPADAEAAKADSLLRHLLKQRIEYWRDRADQIQLNSGDNRGIEATAYRLVAQSFADVLSIDAGAMEGK